MCLNCRSPRSSPKPTTRGRWCSRCRTGPNDPAIPAERLRYAPGQFLTLRVPSDRTGSVARCYSLCSSPFTDDALTVTVKRTADGYASNWLCDNAHKGMRIHVLAAVGQLRAQDARRRLPAAGRRQRDHPDHVDLQVGARPKAAVR